MSSFIQQITLPSGRRKRIDGTRIDNRLIEGAAITMDLVGADAPFELLHHDLTIQVVPDPARSIHNMVWRLSLPQRPTSALMAVGMRSRQGDRLWRWITDTLGDELIGPTDAEDRPRAPWLLIVPYGHQDSENGPGRIPHLESLAQRIAWAWATCIYTHGLD